MIKRIEDRDKKGGHVLGSLDVGPDVSRLNEGGGGWLGVTVGGCTIPEVKGLKKGGRSKRFKDSSLSEVPSPSPWMKAQTWCLENTK